MTPQKTNLIYIGPMGYSGSTLLDLILNQHEEIQSVGELIFYDRWRKDNLLCSCSKPMDECAFWNKVQKMLPDDFRLHGELNRLKTFTGLDLFTKKTSSTYVEQTYKLVDKVSRISSVKYVLDSSKSVGRLEKLAEGKQVINLKVIHLIRNGKSVVQSSLKEKARPSYDNDQKTSTRSAYKTALRWFLVNRRMKKVINKFSLDSIEIRYEDLINDPQDELNRIFSFLDLEAMEITNTIDNSNIHNISGSRWRFDNQIEIVQTKQNHNLSGYQNFIFNLIAGNLYKSYGYK